MIPFPDDTPKTIRETKEFIKKINKLGSKIYLSYTTPYPGTYFYEHADEIGIKIHAHEWEEFDAKHNIMETKHLSMSEIESLIEELVREAGLKRSTT